MIKLDLDEVVEAKTVEKSLYSALERFGYLLYRKRAAYKESCSQYENPYGIEYIIRKNFANKPISIVSVYEDSNDIYISKDIMKDVYKIYNDRKIASITYGMVSDVLKKNKEKEAVAFMKTVASMLEQSHYRISKIEKKRRRWLKGNSPLSSRIIRLL